MAKEKGKYDGLLCFLLALIVVLILVIGGGAYYFLVVDNGEEVAENENTVSTNAESNVQKQENKLINLSEAEKKDIRATIENYYKLITAKENSSTSMLTNVMRMTVYAVQDPEYAPDNYIEHPNSIKYMWTGIKYEDFRNNLWYISDNMLKEKFSEFVEYKNYLYIDNNNTEAFDFKYEITKQEISTSSTIDICICDVTVKNSKTGKTIDSKITMSRCNGDFVIVSVDNN